MTAIIGAQSEADAGSVRRISLADDVDHQAAPVAVQTRGRAGHTTV